MAALLHITNALASLRIIITFQGPSDILEAEVYILWPSFRPNGDPLLYLTGQPLVEGKGRCAFVADVNPYGLEVLRFIFISFYINITI